MKAYALLMVSNLQMGAQSKMYEVVDTALKPGPADSFASLTRVRRKVEDMHELSQRCQKRLAGDLERRLGVPSDVELLSMMLHPITKNLLPCLQLRLSDCIIARIPSSPPFFDASLFELMPYLSAVVPLLERKVFVVHMWEQIKSMMPGMNEQYVFIEVGEPSMHLVWDTIQGPDGYKGAIRPGPKAPHLQLLATIARCSKSPLLSRARELLRSEMIFMAQQFEKFQDAAASQSSSSSFASSAASSRSAAAREDASTPQSSTSQEPAFAVRTSTLACMLKRVLKLCSLTHSHPHHHFLTPTSPV